MRELLLALACVSCGADEPQPVAAVGAEQQQAQRPELYAVRVDAVENLPYCEGTANGRVVYVQSTKSFKVCEAAVGEWFDIELKGDRGEQGKQGEVGPKGEPGASGPTGPRGDTGIAGADGQDGSEGRQGDAGAVGATGATGAAGKPAADREWYDPITNLWWTAPTLTSTFAEAQATCVGSYRVPTAAEYRIAVLRGLPHAAAVWTSSGGRVNPGGVDPGDSNTSASPYCVQQ